MAGFHCGGRQRGGRGNGRGFAAQRVGAGRPGPRRAAGGGVADDPRRRDRGGGCWGGSGSGDDPDTASAQLLGGQAQTLGVRGAGTGVRRRRAGDPRPAHHLPVIQERDSGQAGRLHLRALRGHLHRRRVLHRRGVVNDLHKPAVHRGTGRRGGGGTRRLGERRPHRRQPQRGRSGAAPHAGPRNRRGRSG